MKKAHEEQKRCPKYGHGGMILGSQSNYQGSGSILGNVVVEEMSGWASEMSLVLSVERGEKKVGKGGMGFGVRSPGKGGL